MTRAAKYAASWWLIVAAACDSPSEPTPQNPADLLPPSVSVTSPARGAMLESGTNDPSSITVTGEACHESSPIASLTVNGSSVTVSGDQLCEDFSVTVDSPWGMTSVTIVAKNKLGRETTDTRAFLRSPAYYPAALTRAAGARLSPGAEMRVTAAGFNKLRSAITTAAPPFVLGSSIPNPIANTEPAQPLCVVGRIPDTATGYRIQRGTVSVPSPSIFSSITNQQTLRFVVTFPNVSMPVTVTGYSKTSCDPVVTSSATGSVSQSVTADISAITGITPTTGGITTGITINSASNSGLTLTLNLDGMTFLTAAQKTAIMSAVLGAFSGSIVDDVVLTTRERFAEEFLKFPASVTLPARNLAEIGLDLDAVVGDFRLINNGMTFGFGTQVVPLTPRTGDAPARGTIRSAIAARPVTDPANDVAFGFNDDFLNAILWAAWQGGSFDAADLTNLVGSAPGLSLSLRSLLPPVVTRPAAGTIRISWGDVQLSGTVSPIPFRLPGETSTAPAAAEAHATVVLDATLAFDPVSGRLVLGDLASSATVQWNHIPTVQLDENAIRSAIRDAIRDAAIELLAPVIAAIPIGEAVLADFANYPAGATMPIWETGIARAGGYDYVWGRIQSPAPATAVKRE